MGELAEDFRFMKEQAKNEIISKLQTIYSCAALKPHECEWILQVIDYIKEETHV